MVRITIILSFLVIACPRSALAEPESDPRLARALALQKVMTAAKNHLRENQPAQAVMVLEAEILHVDGNVTFLALMKDAYIAYLKELKLKSADSDKIDHVTRQLRLLDPKIDLERIVASAPERPASTVSSASSDDADPFQQVPLDGAVPADLKSKATAAFAQKNYAQAVTLFTQVIQAKIELTKDEGQAYSYCRLHEVVSRLNNPNSSSGSLDALEKEASAAMKLGGEPMDKFGQKVLSEIRKRKSNPEPSLSTAVPEGWQTLETDSFRVFFQNSRQQAVDIGAMAERVRAETFEKWSGPAGAAWSPRCDLWLHATGNDYAKATDKLVASLGHSSIGMKQGKIMARRIDLRCDDAAMQENTLPREVAYVVVSDLFPEQPLPRWADIGMTISSTSTGEISRYLRALPQLVKEKKALSLRDLLRMTEFPEAQKITPFYVESVSLVAYLVGLKGPKAFALYLREAPRRGYEEALQRHYGFKDAGELQERWLKFAMGNQ